jgi:FkbM family methyltransferase
VRKFKAIARRIISLTLRKFFNPLSNGGSIWRLPLLQVMYNFFYRHLAPLGIFEPGTVRLIKKLLGEGMTFVDLGAHRGYYTLLASKLVGRTGRVFAFEPAPFNYSLLMINVKGRENVRLVQKAVSDKSGLAKFYLSPDASVTHSLYRHRGNWQEVEVEVTSLDDFFQDKDCRVDLIKMDIEGAELSALEGMKSVIQENENLKIITEFQPVALESSSRPPRMLLETLVENGYSLYVINDDTESISLQTVDEIVDLFANGTEIVAVNIYCEKPLHSSDKTEL